MARLVGEERRVDLGVVEAGHRPGIEPERARRDDEIGALQRGVAEGALVALGLVAVEPALGVGVREQPRQLLVEIDVRSR